VDNSFLDLDGRRSVQECFDVSFHAHSPIESPRPIADSVGGISWKSEQLSWVSDLARSPTARLSRGPELPLGPSARSPVRDWLE
jgi:hypothetical protein